MSVFTGISCGQGAFTVYGSALGYRTTRYSWAGIHENIGTMLKQILTLADLLGLRFRCCICFFYAVIFDH